MLPQSDCAGDSKKKGNERLWVGRTSSWRREKNNTHEAAKVGPQAHYDEIRTLSSSAPNAISPLKWDVAKNIVHEAPDGGRLARPFLQI